jgi:hypothetical protein
LKKNRIGRIVSKKASEAAKKRPTAKIIGAWGKAVKSARKTLKITGFCPVGGKSAEGQKLLKAVREIVAKN